VTDRKFSTVVKILGYQVLITTIITFGFAVAYGWQSALSPALGGMAAFVPNFYFALRIYKSAGQEARKIVRSFYAGESGKLLLTGLFFAMIFQIPNIHIVPLFVSYAGALSVFWFALLLR
jgi:ATP synthase protein I